MSRSVFSGLCALLLLTSCNPWHFKLQRQTGWEVEGKIYDHKELVDVTAGNTVTVQAPASVAVRCEPITDGIFNAEVTLFERGDNAAHDEVVFAFRSTPYEDTVSSQKADYHPSTFAVVVSNDYAFVIHQDTTYAVHGIMPQPGTPFRIIVVQHGRSVAVNVACTDLGQYQVGSPSTQWVSIRPQANQRVEVRDPQFRPLVEDVDVDVASIFDSLFR